MAVMTVAKHSRLVSSSNLDTKTNKQPSLKGEVARVSFPVISKPALL